MKYFTGIDVSLRSVSICVVDEAGEVQYEGKVPAEVDLIVAALQRCKAEIMQVGLEAGTLTQYLTYGLQKAGFEVICLEARQTAATLAAMRNKTDRNDARGLAQILRTGWYRTVHVKSLESHQVRALLASARRSLPGAWTWKTSCGGCSKSSVCAWRPTSLITASMRPCAPQCRRLQSSTRVCCRCSMRARCCTRPT